MIIKIAADGFRFTIPIPIVLVFNRISIRIITNCLAKYSGYQLTGEQLAMLGNELRRAKKALRQLPLVDVVSNDGSRVKITL